MLGWVKLVPSRRRPGLQVPFILSSSSVGRFLFLFCIREQTLYYVVDLLGRLVPATMYCAPEENIIGINLQFRHERESKTNHRPMDGSSSSLVR